MYSVPMLFTVKMFRSTHKLTSFISCVFFISAFFTSSLAQDVGQSCTVRFTGNDGICELVSDCPSVVEQANVGIRPTLCGRRGSVPIVCCDSPVANPFSIDVSDSEGSFVFPNNDAAPSSLRKSERMCLKYGRLFTETVQAIPLVTNPKPLSVDVPKCDNSVPLIVGGAPAKPGEFPHMAVLGYSGSNEIEWNCGATLISDQFVITAAHCVKTSRDGRRLTRVRLGDLDLTRTDDGAQPEEFGIAQVIIHPEYKPPEKYNDIALIQLSRQVYLTRFITPACLWTKYDIPSSNRNELNALATGWGHTSFGGEKSDTLMKVTLPLISNTQCNEYFKSSHRLLPDGIRRTMICAGEKNGGKDACQGDSGGPLQIIRPDNSCLFDMIGITSFGKGCANPNTAGVFTRISEFVPWIEGIVWP